VIHIITGKMNSGKTTKIIETYQNIQKGTGIVSKKKMVGKSVYGFFGHVLSTGEDFPYFIHKSQLDDGKKHDRFIYQIGPYYVYETAQEFVEAFYKTEIAKHTSPLFFDEVGKLELQDKGFASSIREALQEDIELYMTVREDLIDSILVYFKIKDVEIMTR
jgi:nucleoside-triphosphatase THEP1